MNSNTHETLRSPHTNQRACTLLLILEGTACIFQQGIRELIHHLNSTRNNRSELYINMNFESNGSDVMTYPTATSHPPKSFVVDDADPYLSAVELSSYS